ncbi:hypothetical protein DSO57_1012339 [Entomophthora muscae]|uniref:Uncharacterized protein n=1 Tax=Entomophthora muscae TaxID=34485 RepID=A0ACC2SV46_9FUNG|nr:hypothetical protein DSO57_1012339 [Entomophthora muscae]
MLRSTYPRYVCPKIQHTSISLEDPTKIICTHIRHSFNYNPSTLPDEITLSMFSSNDITLFSIQPALSNICRSPSLKPFKLNNNSAMHPKKCSNGIESSTCLLFLDAPSRAKITAQPDRSTATRQRNCRELDAGVDPSSKWPVPKRRAQAMMRSATNLEKF